MVGIYHGLVATDRFDYHVLDAVACNGAGETHGEQAKFWKTNNLPKVFLASYFTYNR